MRKHLCVIFLLCLSMRLLGQAPGTGAYPFATFDTPGFDSVNVGNLNVRFTIPIVNRTGRGTPFNYALQYEGLVWANAGGVWTPNPTWGFTGVLNGTAFAGFMTHSRLTHKCLAEGSRTATGTYIEYTNYIYHDAFGGVHRFDYDYQSSCPNAGGGDDSYTGDGSADDNSGYSLNVANTNQVLILSGGVINPALSATGQDSSSTIDSNGNQISASGNGVFTDTLGMTALTISGTSPRTFTYPVTLQQDNSTTAQATLAYQNYTVRTNFQCSGVVEYGSNTVSLPSQMTMPDGRSYSFSYEATPGASDGAVTGRLGSITLPTGGAITYAYSSGCGGGINSDGTVGIMTRTTTDGTRRYNRAPINANSTSTTLVDESGNQTYYAFTIDAVTYNFYETHRQVYQGSTSNGAQLSDRYTCYNGATANCDGAAMALPISEADVTQSYNGGVQDHINNSYNAKSGLLTSSTGSYSKQTLSYNALGEPLAVTQADTNGNTIAQTTYGYDETSPTATSNIPQHATPSSTPGNQTSSHVLISGSSTLDTKTTYYDTGMPVTTVAPGGFTTSYGYDATQAFVTQVTLPTPTSNVALSTSATYDAQSAMALTSTGLNSDQTKINQYDRMLRPVNATLPNGSVVSYDWYSVANRVVANQTMGNGQNAYYMTLVDGYGRMSRTALLASNTWYMTDYCYDATGRLQFQTLPYAAQGSFNTTKQCSGTGTTYTYDAMGRVTSVANADGTVSTTYQGRAVKTTDVNNVQKITQYDLAGRLAGVCEISSNALAGQSPTTCSANGAAMDISGTGYNTTYAYDLANHKMTATQGQQNRVTQTDAAGRTILVSEPERGQTTYAYSYISSGLQVIRARPLQNQTNSASLTHVTTLYDALSRVIAINHDDGQTPDRNFYYDQAQAFLNNGSSANVKGLLSAGISGSGATRTTFQYTYDIMGNVTGIWQCAPSICGTQYSRPEIQLGYDLVGNLTLEADATTGSIAYGRSPAGQITSVTNQTYNDANNPTNLAANIANTPFGPAVVGLGNGLNAAHFFDNVGRKSSNFLCPGNTQAGFNCSGELYGTLQDNKGVQATRSCDTVNNSCVTMNYDEFNRLTGFNGNTWTYDRWGNRLSQSGSPSVTFNYDPATNHNSSYGYDAAGNQTNDALHSYTYDSEGNVTAVDGGSTAQYVYDAANRRVRVQTGSSAVEYLFDPMGQRISTWTTGAGTAGFGIEGRIWMDGELLATRGGGNMTYFHHTNTLGTERMRTDASGNVATTSRSAAFGDGFSQTASAQSGVALDNQEFAGLDADDLTVPASTHHATFRQYSSAQGSWMSPDPYDGSYDSLNPQSLNRYSYVLNNPLIYMDRSGMVPCGYGENDYEEADDDDECTSNGGTVYSQPGASTSVNSNDGGGYSGVVVGVGTGGVSTSNGNTAGSGTSAAPSNPSCGVSASSIDSYLGTKNSPMVGQGANFMNSGAQYNLDPRLLVSLSGAETGFGKNITAGQFNAFNVLYNGHNSPFNSFQSAINSAGHSLTNPRNGYDLSSTATVYHTYCSTGTTCGAGLNNVNTFMRQQGANINALHYPCKKD